MISVVLWFERDGAPPSSPYELRVGDRLIATWHFTGIELYALDAEALIRPGLLGLLPLVPFTRGGGDLAAIERTGDVVKQQAPPDQVADLELLLAVFGARAVGTEPMRAMLRRLSVSTEILQTSPLDQEWSQEWREEGIKAGREEGRVVGAEQGLEPGLEQGLREGVTMVLTARFGALPEAVTQALASATAATLRDPLAHATTESLDELAARLGER